MDAINVLVTAPPDSKNIGQGLGLGTQDNAAEWKTDSATTALLRFDHVRPCRHAEV